MIPNRRLIGCEISGIDIVFDPDTGLYIHIASGQCLEPDELPEKKGLTISTDKVTPPSIDEFFASLIEQFGEGLSRAANGNWAKSIKYPEMEVGQTAPFLSGEVPLETYNVGNKVVRIKDTNKQGNLSGTYQKRYDPGIEFELVDIFRNHYTKTKRNPDCVSIEGKETPDMQTPDDDLRSVFEAMFTLLRRLREDPQGQWVKAIPTLVDFLVDNVSYVENHGEEIGIPELLSTFTTMRREINMLKRTNQCLIAEETNLRKQRNQLRGLIYGKHKNHKTYT